MTPEELEVTLSKLDLALQEFRKAVDDLLEHDPVTICKVARMLGVTKETFLRNGEN